jgi:hypothetical protein
MVIGVTHGNNKNGPGGAFEDKRMQASSRNDSIIMKFIEGTKKNEQL